MSKKNVYIHVQFEDGNYDVRNIKDTKEYKGATMEDVKVGGRVTLMDTGWDAVVLEKSYDKPCLVSNMNLRIKLDEGKNILKPSSSGRARFARIRDSESEDEENECPKGSKKAERAKSKELKKKVESHREKESRALVNMINERNCGEASCSKGGMGNSEVGFLRKRIDAAMSENRQLKKRLRECEEKRAAVEKELLLVKKKCSSVFLELKRRCDEEMALLRSDGDSPVAPGEEPGQDVGMSAPQPEPKELTTQVNDLAWLDVGEEDENGSDQLMFTRESDGVVELVSGAGLYIPAKQLANCRKESRSITTLVNSLVRCVFTKEARELCSAVGNERVKGNRPGLHRRSLSIILKYAVQNGKQMGWKEKSQPDIIKSLNTALGYDRLELIRSANK